MRIRAQFLAFALAGGTAAAVNILSRVALNLVMPFEVAVVAAYVVALTTAFTLNKLFVFRGATGSISGQYARFVAVNLFALVQVWAVSVGLARFLFPMIGFVWHADTVAHVIGVASPVFSSYYGHKRFTFAARRAGTPDRNQ